MKNAKLILTAIAILVAAFIVWMLVGFVVLAVKVLFVLAILLFLATMIRKLSGKSRPREIAENDSDRELNEAMRQLEEIKSRQLIK
jgi:membrane protein implicated in regulation of membrane protease activity